jgi:membrane associated rhomboid family serine protease
MGIYDRDYYQEEEKRRWGGGSRIGGGRSMVINLILLNVAIYIADLVFDNKISSAFSLKSDLFRQPWLCWQLVTYGFVHDPHDIRHILFNMFGLWIFGTSVEDVYGKAEFLRIYLVSIVLCGLAWLAFTATAAGPASLVGASGGIMCVMILFVLHFPRRMLYIWGVLPVPAWGIATLYVVFDIMGLGSDSGVAHVAHLAGVAFGFIYFRAGWNLGRLVPSRLSPGSLRRKPRLRVHEPRDDSADLNRKVDQILEKVGREGEASLTKSERRTLEEASRRYQRRRE